MNHIKLPIVQVLISYMYLFSVFTKTKSQISSPNNKETTIEVQSKSLVPDCSGCGSKRGAGERSKFQNYFPLRPRRKLNKYTIRAKTQREVTQKDDPQFQMPMFFKK